MWRSPPRTNAIGSDGTTCPGRSDSAGRGPSRRCLAAVLGSRSSPRADSRRFASWWISTTLSTLLRSSPSETSRCCDRHHASPDPALRAQRHSRAGHGYVAILAKRGTPGAFQVYASTRSRGPSRCDPPCRSRARRPGCDPRWRADTQRCTRSRPPWSSSTSLRSCCPSQGLPLSRVCDPRRAGTCGATQAARARVDSPTGVAILSDADA